MVSELESTIPGELARRLKGLVLDVDGVLTDGRLRFGPEGEAIKVFHAHDGLGIKLVARAGIEVAIITAKTSPMVRLRGEQLGIEHVLMGRGDKLHAVQELSESMGFALDEMAFVGDDIIDLPAMRACGLGLTVADAHPILRAEAAWVSTRGGGQGAVREICDALIGARQDLAAFVDEYLESIHSGAKKPEVVQ